MPVGPARLRELYALFASIRSAKEAKMLLDDLLTPRERAMLAKRWQIVRELEKGTPQRDIADKLHLSISKITRGSRVLQHGSGGVRRFLKRMGKRRG